MASDLVTAHAAETATAADSDADGMFTLIERLYPICRSLTGDGVRETLRIVSEVVPLDIHDIATGTAVLDWSIPREWNIRDAYVADSSGRRVIDFRAHNLHVVNYSVPIRARMSLTELRPHLHTLRDRPDLIPYVTSYYAEAWGFCLAQSQLDTLADGEYEVVIDSDLRAGSMTYGEWFLPGASEDEVLLSAHVCHPSLANDNLSGIAVLAHLARSIASRPRHYSYRILFAPGTIGSIAWLATHEEAASRIKHGLVLAGVGDRGAATYKQTRRGDAEIDRAMAHLLDAGSRADAVRPFSPWGYDERQYNSPGFNLAVGCLMRTPHGTYPEYHTSADDLGFIAAESLADSLRICREMVELLERNRTYRNLSPKGEPQLGRRGLYSSTGGGPAGPDRLAMLWVLNQSDGSHSLLDIAERSGLSFQLLASAATALEAAGLLAAVPG
jgi:aminopeptidase-like protein